MDELKWLLTKFFIECDMGFVFIDVVHDAILVHRDLYGKRSLVLQASEVEGNCQIMISSS